MPASSSPHDSKDDPQSNAAEFSDAKLEDSEPGAGDATLGDAVHDEEATVVMGKPDLPDFQNDSCSSDDSSSGKDSDSKEDGGHVVPEKRVPQRPSTFTRLLLNPRH